MATGFAPVDHATTTVSWDRRRPSPVFAQNGMVAAAHPLITATGLDVLRRGGNAVDAAVAAALTAAVVMPEMCGLGGDLFALVHAPASPGHGGTGETVAVLGSGVAPRGATTELMRAHGDASRARMPYQGPLSVGVPGMVDAYAAMLTRFGSRPLVELVEPAIGYASDGFPIAPLGAKAIVENAALLGGFPSSAAVFLPGGVPSVPGTVLRQPDLARTLRQIAAEGADAFYRGEIAERIGRFMAEAGGALSADDLAGHATDMAPPISTVYRGHTVYQTGLPTQGMILLEALNIVAQADLSAIGVDSATGVHLLGEAKKLAYADRLGYAGDPAFIDTPLDTLLSPEWGARRFARIDPERAAEDVPAGAFEEGDTTYLCVVDAQGMMVSLIQSVSSSFGSGVVAGDTGIVLNNRVGRGFTLEEGHPNVFAPGKKTMHTLNCYLIADSSGTMVVAGGTPGGDGQPQWNLQVIAGLIDGGLDVQAAIELPRWTSWPGTDPITLPNPFELRVEDRLGDTVIADLERRGHRVRRTGPWGGGGSAQAIFRDPETGVLAGGSDPRVEGLALGF
ncbi:MAG: gamma-glutamyltransferase [Chloroflexota bacterium]|nr:gamma-glutamyltransferase [Chloroflexota bacterium]